MVSKQNSTRRNLIEERFIRIGAIGVKIPFRPRKPSTLGGEAVSKFFLIAQDIFARRIVIFVCGCSRTWRDALREMFLSVIVGATFRNQHLGGRGIWAGNGPKSTRRVMKGGGRLSEKFAREKNAKVEVALEE